MSGTYISDEIDQMIRDNYEKEITECPESSERYRNIGTLYVDERSMEYYIWWRTCVRNGIYPEANKSLITFFIRELFVMNEPDSVIERWLKFLSKVYSNNDYIHAVNDLLCDNYTMKGQLPQSIKDIKGSVTDYSIPLILSGPSITLVDRQIRILTDHDGELPLGFNEFFSMVLENLAMTLWERFDSNIVEYLSHEREEYIHHPLKNYRDDTPSILVDAPCRNRTFEQRFANLFQNCLKTYNDRFKGKTKIRTDRMTEDAIKKALNNLSSNIPRPTEWHPERFVTIKKYDGRRCRGRYDPEYECYPWERTTVFANDGKISAGRNRPLKGEMVEFSKIRSKGPHDYVKSGNKCPFPSSLNKDEMEFYLYWREQFREGKCIPTDEDYISLFIYETLITDSNNTSTMDVLLKLAKNYECKLTAETCMSYAITKGMELPPYGDFLNDFSKSWDTCIIHDALKRNPVGKIPYRTITSYLGADKRKYTDIDKHGFTELANQLIVKFDERILKDTNKRLFDIGSQKEEKISIPVFESMSFYNVSRSFQINIPVLLDSNELSDILSAAYMFALETVCKRNGCGYPRAKSIKTEYRRMAVGFIEE